VNVRDESRKKHLIDSDGQRRQIEASIVEDKERPEQIALFTSETHAKAATGRGEATVGLLNLT